MPKIISKHEGTCCCDMSLSLHFFVCVHIVILLLLHVPAPRPLSVNNTWFCRFYMLLRRVPVTCPHVCRDLKIHVINKCILIYPAPSFNLYPCLMIFFQQSKAIELTIILLLHWFSLIVVNYLFINWLCWVFDDQARFQMKYWFSLIKILFDLNLPDLLKPLGHWEKEVIRVNFHNYEVKPFSVMALVASGFIQGWRTLKVWSIYKMYLITHACNPGRIILFITFAVLNKRI